MTTRFSSFLFALALLPISIHAATFTVVNTNSSGTGSLRQAILDANASGGADTIAFAITNLSLTISPTSALPNLTDPVTVDGSTQPGFSNAPIVEISGVNAGANANGLIVAASSCVIRSLAINQFRNDGVQITNGINSRVEGCYIGVAPDGFTRRGNGAVGVRIAGVNFNVQTTGTNTIGGEDSTAHNLISANNYGVWLAETTANRVLGNIIGADATGAFDVGNTNMGLFCTYLASGNIIGGTNVGSRNLISGNGEEPNLYAGDGIRLDSCSSNAVYGNYIGVNSTGTAAIPNGEHGVNIQYGNFNLIGGAAAGQSNLISGNLVHGVNLGGFGEASLTYAGTPPPLPDGNIIQGNLIGTDVTGQSAIPNQSDGVFIGNMQGNLVGGYLAGERNVISGNLNHGVEIVSYGAISNQVAGNFIGITLNGALPLGNLSDGVYITANFNMVGGSDTGAGNIIAYNGGSGVDIGFNSGNWILRNSIYANTNLGIDLGGDYVSFNDVGDEDNGANDFQNYPVLSRAVTNATQTLITASLSSGTNITYRAELFDNPTNDDSGYGEGKTFLGYTNVTTDGNGVVAFMFTNSSALPLGHYITATATDPNGNTSEFSYARKVVRADSVDIAVTIAESADPLPRFTNFTYTVTVTNYGPTNATGVFVTNTLSPGLTFVSAAPTQGSTSFSAGVVTWNVGALVDGAGASVVLTVHGNVTALESNSVVAIAAQLENDSLNNSVVETTSIGIADLGMTLSDSPDPVVAGQPVTYTLIVTNLGPDTASGSTVNFYLDGNLFITGASASQGSFAQYGNYVQVLFGSINAHATATLTVTGLPTAVGTNFNNGNLSRLELDPNSSNDSDFEETVVQAGPGVLEFTSATYSVNESGGSALISVQRLGGAIGTVAGYFATSNLTATAGSDYTATNGVLVFTNGETLKSFSVAINNDILAECNETLALRLFSPTGGVILLPPTNAVLEIFDNEITPVGTVKVISLAQTNLLTTGNSVSSGMSISDDGRYVSYYSYANNLVPTTDQNGSGDVFVHDRVTHSNTLVSVNAQGVAANSQSVVSTISADGSRVGFLSYASDLTTNTSTGTQQIYVRTLASGVNQLVTVNTNGAGGNSYSYTFSLSTNGAKITYQSAASDLVAYVGDSNFTSDVFFRDLTTGTNILVSVNSAGTASANDYSDRPVISADGRYVVFGSQASNLSPSDTNTRYDIYRRDVISNVTALVSANTGGVAGNTSSEYPYAVSAGGRYVSFASQATDLVAGTPSFTKQIFRRDLNTGTTIIVSRNNSGVAASGFADLRGMSRDGRYVLFDTYASNVTTNDNNFSSDVFVRDCLSNVTYIVSINRTNTGTGDAYSVGDAISPDGRYVTFHSIATDLVNASSPAFTYQLYQRDILSATTTLLTTRFADTNGANSGINDCVVSTNGVAVFSSYASDMVQVDANSSLDAFARAPGDTNATLLSFALGVTGSSYASQNVMNQAGTKLAFSSYSANLVTNDNNFDQDIFLRDLVANTTKLVSVNAAGTGGATGFSENSSLSEDGRYVVYQSGAQDIAGNDANGFTDVYLRDTVAGTNALVSINQNGNGAGNEASVSTKITPDGRFIIFESRASNLVSNDVNGASSDIFIRTRTNNITQLISLNSSGTTSANSDSYNARISPDGRYVVYETFASNLGPADTNARYDVYARDRQTASNILCSPNLAGSNGGNEDSFQPVISDDGSTVVLFSYANNLVAGDTNNAGDVFAFNLATRTLRLVSTTASGIPGNGSSYGPSVSANGRYVAFQSDSTNLVANADLNGSSADIFVRDLVANTTTLVSINCHGTGTGDDASYSPQISADGRYVTFTSAASDIVPGVFTQYSPNVFRRDLQTGTTILISQNRFFTGAGNASSYNQLVSSNGAVVSFLSDASDLVTDDANHSLDVFAWNSGLVVTGVDLTMTKTASISTTGAYNNFTYTLAVTNNGTAPATGVSVTDILPAGVSFVSATTTQGTVTNSVGTITATVGSLGVGAGARINIIVTATNAASITNTATTTANESDVTPVNNTSSVIVTITPLTTPLLTPISTNGNQLLITWPSTTPNVFFAQTATNLTPAIAWVTLTNSISDNGTIKFVLLNVNANEPERFYRLKK